MSYEVLIRRRAAKQLAELPLREYERVKLSIFALGDNPRPQGCLKLTGRAGWRIRKITRRLTTEWFARRVEERYKRCLK